MPTWRGCQQSPLMFLAGHMLRGHSGVRRERGWQVRAVAAARIQARRVDCLQTRGLPPVLHSHCQSISFTCCQTPVNVLQCLSCLPPLPWNTIAGSTFTACTCTHLAVLVTNHEGGNVRSSLHAPFESIGLGGLSRIKLQATYRIHTTPVKGCKATMRVHQGSSRKQRLLRRKQRNSCSASMQHCWWLSNVSFGIKSPRRYTKSATGAQSWSSHLSGRSLPGVLCCRRPSCPSWQQAQEEQEARHRDPGRHTHAPCVNSNYRGFINPLHTAAVFQQLHQGPRHKLLTAM